MAYLLVLTRLLVVMLFLCNRFHFSAADFTFGQASNLSNTISRHHLDTVSDEDLYVVSFAAELLCLRDQSYILTNDVVLNKDDLNNLLSVVLCQQFFSFFFFLLFFALGSFSALS